MSASRQVWLHQTITRGAANDLFAVQNVGSKTLKTGHNSKLTTITARPVTIIETNKAIALAFSTNPRLFSMPADI